jgi:hypothetical protein
MTNPKCTGELIPKPENQLIFFSLHLNRRGDNPQRAQELIPKSEIRKPTNPLFFSLHLNSTAAVKRERKGNKKEM